MRRCPLGLLIGIALTVLLSNPAAGQAPSFEPTPDEHMTAVESAQKIGLALFIQHYVSRQAADIVAAEFGNDPEIVDWLVNFRSDGLTVRFLGRKGDEIRALYQVTYVGQQPEPPVRFDPPAPAEPGEDVLLKAKLAALEAGSVCPGAEYLSILVPLELTSRPGIEAYVLANSTPERTYVAGHAKVRVDYDGTTVQEIEPLSKSCLALDRPPGPEPELVAGNHLLSSTPIASHVFTSLQIEKPLLISTAAGAWLVLGNRIHFTGSPPDEPQTREPDLRKTWMNAPDSGWQPDGGEPTIPPPWRERLIVWRDSDDTATPWRDDDRFRGQFEEGYPDDLQVAFPPDPGDNRGEAMWVRVHAYHPESDRYLGTVLNQARWLKGLFRGDNVEFMYAPQIGRPLALRRDGAYDSLSVPPAVRDGELAELYRGVLQYRTAQFDGYATSPLDACIDTLTRVVVDQAGALEGHHRYLAHYTLGRCLAERYETDRAIEQFEVALELRPDAIDPNMALLAELSVKVHDPEEDPARWDDAFVARLERVRELASSDPMAAETLDRIFDESLVEQTRGDLSEAEIERRRRIGFAVIRWKKP